MNEERKKVRSECDTTNRQRWNMELFRTNNLKKGSDVTAGE
jgi:hypothetical protein